MTDKEILIDGINVSELTGEQLVCMNRYEVARLFTKLVDVLSETEDSYNNVQEDRVRMWANNTSLTDKLKRKEQECEELKHKVELMMDCASCKIDEYEQTLTEIKEVNKYKQALDEIEKYLDTQQKYFDGEDYHNLLDIISKVKGGINEES